MTKVKWMLNILTIWDQLLRRINLITINFSLENAWAQAILCWGKDKCDNPAYNVTFLAQEPNDNTMVLSLVSIVSNGSHPGAMFQ